MFGNKADKLYAFYRGVDTDNKGRSISDIFVFTDTELEKCHNYIQWLFPIDTKSNFNIFAPVLTEEICVKMRADNEVLENLIAAFVRIVQFYGFIYVDNKLVDGPNFLDRSSNWLMPNNHNYMRITRILRSLYLLGFENLSLLLLDKLEDLYANGYKSVITETALNYWRGFREKQQ